MKQIAIVLFMVVISSAVPSFSAEWIPIQDVQDWYLDKSNIRTDSSGNTWYWIKTVLPDNLIKATADISKRSGNPVDYSKYVYTLRYQGVNCKQGTQAVSKGTNFDENGSVIESWKSEKIEFEPDTPDSIGELVSKTVCNIISKKNKSKSSK